MDNSPGNFNILKPGKPGDTRELSETVLETLKIEGKYDSYFQVYELDGLRWKTQSKITRPTGETFYILVCLEE